MKKQKDRVTAAQFDQAIFEEIAHARGLNVPSNALSSALTFGELISKRLFGERPARNRSTAYLEMYKEVVDLAREERRQAILKAREAQQAAEQRIIIPGQGAGRN